MDDYREYSAYVAGQWACWGLDLLDENPYNSHTQKDQYLDWKQGWLDQDRDQGRYE